MRSSPRREAVDLVAYLDRLVPPVSEAAYEGVAGYGFARRFVADKKVADLCWQEMGHGTRLLAETAGSVSGMAVSAEAVEVASRALPAPNVSYEVTEGFSALPYADDHFDAMVALGLIEHLDQPEAFVTEARRVIRSGGVFIASFPDGGPSGASDVPGLLDAHFEQVRLYRQGAVSGGVVYPVMEEVDEASLESLSPLLPLSNPNGQPPITTSIVAVCGATGLTYGDERPYLLLDSDRRVFDECADRAEDVEALRDEIENMQQTEVQAFRDALKLRDNEISYLRARIRRAEGRAQRLQVHVRNMERSMVWRIFRPYRWLRGGIEVVRRLVSGRGGGPQDRG